MHTTEYLPLISCFHGEVLTCVSKINWIEFWSTIILWSWFQLYVWAKHQPFYLRPRSNPRHPQQLQECPVLLLWCPLQGSNTNLHFPIEVPLTRGNLLCPFKSKVQDLLSQQLLQQDPFCSKPQLSLLDLLDLFDQFKKSLKNRNNRNKIHVSSPDSASAHRPYNQKKY